MPKNLPCMEYSMNTLAAWGFIEAKKANTEYEKPLIKQSAVFQTLIQYISC